MGDRTRVISDFSVLPAAPGEGKAGEYWYHEETQAWFDDADHYRTVRAMCGISCTVCEGNSNRGKKGGKTSKAKHKSKFRSIEQLKGHLFNQHSLYMCDLCLDGRKVFIREQKLYTRPQLNRHIVSGDSEVDGSKVERSGFIGHPLCEFCKIPFYGENELYTHMTREHYSCHICQRQHCGQYDYFRNYDDLEMHFWSDHFFCEDKGCLGKKFIVFQSEAELKRHNAVEHRACMPHSQKNAALQTPTSFRDWSDQEQSHGRGRRHNVQCPIGAVDNALLSVQNSAANVGRGLGNQVAAPLRSLSICSSSGHSSQAGQSSGMNRVGQQSYFSPLSCQEVPDARIGSALQESSSPAISEQSRYTPALNQSSRTAARIRDEAFPPLSGTCNRSAALTQQGVRKVAQSTRASGLRQQSKGTVIIHHSVQLWSVENTDSIPSGSSPSPGWPTPNPSPGVGGSFSLASAGNERQETLVNSQMLRTVEDVRAANKSLVERMRTALGMDQDRYATFKEISGEYHQGIINASRYLSYVEQFGLSHLVPEMARLLPDPQKQKELADAYYTNLRLTSLQGNGGGGTVSSKEGNWKRKGKGKVPDATEATSAASKLRSQGGNSGLLLREGCGATDGSQEQQLGWPVKGAWQSRGGHRLFLSNAKR